MDDSNNKPNLVSVLLADPEKEAACNEREIESLYVGAGLDSKTIAQKTHLPREYVQKVIKTNKLRDLRQIYLHRGISKIQNKQLSQAKKLLDIEYDLKRMRLRQLESVLEEYRAYYEKYGDFKKRHPITGDVLYNQSGIALQMNLPSVVKEINAIKSSVTLSQGVKSLLYQLDTLINKPKSKDRVDGGRVRMDSDKSDEVIDMEIYNSVFKKRDEDDED